MRKIEYQSRNSEDFEWIMRNGQVGHLGIINSEGFPRVVPLNFVLIDRGIYFHGATDGEKYQVFKSNAKVTFSVDIPYSIIPSHWLGNENVSPIPIFYKSVHINGEGKIVDNIKEKASALQMLMEKYQPEGGYKVITSTEASYQQVLQKTAVFRIDPVRIEVKIKFGQNLGLQERQTLIKKLEERNQGTDLKTAEEMRKML